MQLNELGEVNLVSLVNLLGLVLLKGILAVLLEDLWCHQAFEKREYFRPSRAYLLFEGK